jgi:4a-hydroxytetrahydrobiopterin dehydratase
MKLTNKRCVPCEGGVEPLAGQELQAYMDEISEGWEVVEGKKLRLQVQSKNFREALALINQIGEIAESENHHPDLHVVQYKQVIIELWTHTIGGLSENDFIVATKIDELI